MIILYVIYKEAIIAINGEFNPNDYQTFTSDA